MSSQDNERGGGSKMREAISMRTSIRAREGLFIAFPLLPDRYNGIIKRFTRYIMN